jgi:NADPH:quinone reductase-like Zn-dependent oxidoreductase
MYQQDGSEYVKKAVADVFKLFLDGKIKPVIDSTWALEDVISIISKRFQ